MSRLAVATCFAWLLSFSLLAQDATLTLEARKAMRRGDFAAAATAYEAIVEAEPENAYAWLMLGHAYHSDGRLDRASQAHRKAAEFPSTRATASYNVACVHALKGETDAAFGWLGKAIGRGFDNFRHAHRDQDLASLRGDPRFEEYMATMRAKATEDQIVVAIFVHEGVELLDFAGPGEVFAGAQDADGKRCLVYTVAQSLEPIVSQGFLTIRPEYTFADCPEPDIIVLPGGNTSLALRSTDVVDWVEHTAAEADVVLSVCTGAFILGEAGLLDGIEATTHWSALEGLCTEFPKCVVRDDQRVVDNGHVVTSAGVSAGIDGALHVVQRLFGREAAERRARGMEYLWQPTTSGEPIATTAAAASVDGATYRCPPCKCKTCGDPHDRPGFCADCGMKLEVVGK